MKFVLNTRKYSYGDESEIKKLEGLGFKFRDSHEGTFTKDKVIQGFPTIEFNSLESLIKFSQEWGEISIDAYPDHDDEISLEIHDGYND